MVNLAPAPLLFKGLAALLDVESFLRERVMMIDSFHHLADHRAAINEAWRVLKPNGVLILQEPDIEQWGGKAIAIFEKALFMRSHLFSAKRVLEMLDERNHQSAVYKRQQFYWLVIQKNPLQN